MFIKTGRVRFVEGGGSPPPVEGETTDDANGSGDQPGNGEGTKPYAVFDNAASFMSRVKQEGRQQVKSLAEELGFESVEAMQAAAKRAKEIEEQNKTDLDKAKDREAELVNQNTALQEKAKSVIVNSEIKVFAVQAGIVDPDVAVAILDRSGISVSEDGKVEGVKEAIDALAKGKPYLLGKGTKSVGSSTNPGGDGDEGLSEVEQGAKIAKERAERKKPVSTVADPWAQN